MATGVRDEKKHDDDSQKSTERLDHEAKTEFEEHNMTDNKGYNETPNDVPIENKDIADEEENTTN